MTPNNEWKNVILSLAATVFFAALCYLSLTSIDGMSWGYAIAFISFFLAVSGVVVALLFVHRARAMDRILSDPSPLARWTYPEEMVKVSVEREYGEFQERNRLMFYVIGGMLGAVALFFMIFMGEGGIETGIILLAIAGLLFVVSKVTPVLERRHALTAPREAIISHTGIIYQGRVYPFRSFLMGMEDVSFKEAGRKAPARIIFSFIQLIGQFLILRPFDVIIPVPAGEEARAEAIARDMGRK